jgi:hypothetical protein
MGFDHTTVLHGCAEGALHAGSMPKRWNFIGVSMPHIVVSAL